MRHSQQLHHDESEQNQAAPIALLTCPLGSVESCLPQLHQLSTSIKIHCINIDQHPTAKSQVPKVPIFEKSRVNLGAEPITRALSCKLIW